MAIMKMKTTASSFRESRSTCYDGSVKVGTSYQATISTQIFDVNLRKQVVKISSNILSLHMGRFIYSRQNCRLQSLQFPALYSFLSFPASLLGSSSAPDSSSPCFSSSSGCSSGASASLLFHLVNPADDNGGRRAGKEISRARREGGSRAMMVEFEPQVHLQNDVGAERPSAGGRWGQREAYMLRRQSIRKARL